MMTRADYRMLARHLGGILGQTERFKCDLLRRQLGRRLEGLLTDLQATNPAFSRAMFLDAVLDASNMVTRIEGRAE